MASTRKIPFLARLMQHRAGRAQSAQQTFRAAAEAIAAGKDPADVDAVDQALAALNKTPEDLQQLADLLAEADQAERSAADLEAARAARRKAQAGVDAAVADRQRALREFDEAVRGAEAALGQADRRLSAAEAAQRQVADLRTRVAAALDADRVARLQDEIEALRRERVAAAAEDRSLELANLRRELGARERELPTIRPESRHDAAAQVDRLRQRIARLEQHPAARRLEELAEQIDSKRRELAAT